MGRFDELIELAQNPGENGIPDSIYDDLRTAYGDEMAEQSSLNEASTAKIQELEGRVSQLKAQNFDKMIASKAEPEPGGNNADGADDDDNDEGEGKGIDELFG